MHEMIIHRLRSDKVGFYTCLKMDKKNEIDSQQPTLL